MTSFRLMQKISGFWMKNGSNSASPDPHEEVSEVLHQSFMQEKNDEAEKVFGNLKADINRAHTCVDDGFCSCDSDNGK